ncbi:MAG: hypothetical protein KTR15_03925 [Phycisphaeraceae bacterium]|nr:hypothetical protein [Phycisphaeraceae bacterium]
MPSEEKHTEAMRLIQSLKDNPLPTWLTQEYDEYLKSSLWKKIRRRILKRDAETCMRCGGPGKQVHHRDYTLDVMAGENDDLLATVCDGCHNIITFADDGEKRSMEEQDQVLLDRDTSTDHPEIKIDLRTGNRTPKEWPRMTEIQRRAWFAEVLRKTKEKREKRKKKIKGT